MNKLKTIRNTVFWISVVVIAGWIELSLLSRVNHYWNTHCSFEVLPKDYRSGN